MVYHHEHGLKHRNMAYAHEHSLHTETQFTVENMVYAWGEILSKRFFSKAVLFYMTKIELNGNTQAFI